MSISPEIYVNVFLQLYNYISIVPRIKVKQYLLSLN